MSELISGKEAMIALANGQNVEYRVKNGTWVLVNDDWKIREFDQGCYEFCLKPPTITINGIDVPKSSDTYSGGLIWILCGTDTREYTSLALGENDELPAYFWSTEEEIKQVVAALRKVFKGE